MGHEIGNHIVIDGKTLHASVDKADGRNPLHRLWPVSGPNRSDRWMRGNFNPVEFDQNSPQVLAIVQRGVSGAGAKYPLFVPRGPGSLPSEGHTDDRAGNFLVLFWGNLARLAIEK